MQKQKIKTGSREPKTSKQPTKNTEKNVFDSKFITRNNRSSFSL